MTKSHFGSLIQSSRCCRDCVFALTAIAAVGISLHNFQWPSHNVEPSRFGFGMSAPIPAVPITDPALCTNDPDSTNDQEREFLAAAQHRSGRHQATGSISPADRTALLLKLLLLQKGYEQLAHIPAYTATFFKQELLNGEVSDAQIMHVKIRHEPFSVYMKWLVGDEQGKELLYVKGRNQGKMLVHQVGWKGRLLPEICLQPDARLAMLETRHPVTQFGLLSLVRTLIDDRRRDLQHQAGVSCRMLDDQICNNRDCYQFVLQYDDATWSAVYRKSHLYIDKEWSLPICIKNYTWPDAGEEIDSPDLDKMTLIEHYSYADIVMDSQLADSDFDCANTNYQFRR